MVIEIVVALWSWIMRPVHKFRARRLFGGDVVQWAEEINESGDTEFELASQALPRMEMIAIASMADNKEELRTLTVSRFNELADDIPEDFA